MRNWTVPTVALLLAACAANPPLEDLSRQPAALSQQPATSATLATTPGSAAAERAVAIDPEAVTEVVYSPNDEAYNAVVCEVRERPGSNIKQKFCMTREAWSARQAASQDQLSDLQREQRWRDEVIREAEMHGRRPTGAGLGPN